MYTLQIRQGQFCGIRFLLEIWTTLVTLSPEVKDFIILDPDKKVTQYQSIPFSHG